MQQYTYEDEYGHKVVTNEDKDEVFCFCPYCRERKLFTRIEEELEEI